MNDKEADSIATRAAATWVVWAYPDDQHYSGAFHRTSAQALAANGMDLDVVSPVGLFPIEPLRSHTRRRWHTSEPSDTFIRDGLVRVARPEYFAYPGQVRLGLPDLVMARRIRRIAPRTDLVHAHGAYPWGLAGLRLANNWRVPLVLTLHGSDVNVYPQQSRLSRARFVRLITRADQVIAVSEALAEKTLRIAGVRPTVLPPGIQIASFRNGNKADARATLGLGDAGPIALYVGDLEPFKGVDLLLEAAQRLADRGIRVVVAGDGSLRRKVEEAEAIRYLGSLPPNLVSAAMHASDALILPSYREGLPTVVCEAGAAGLPVVASGAGGLRGLLADGRGYLIPEMTPRAVYETTCAAISDIAESGRRAELLKSHVSDLYDVDINATHLEAIYRKCL